MNERPELQPEVSDDEVRRAYRALPDEDAPATLDARVLQLAETALAQRRKPAWVRWSAPIALAASVLVVVAILLDPAARKEAVVSHSLQGPPAAPAPAAESLAPAELASTPEATALRADEAKPVTAPERDVQASSKAAQSVEVAERRREQVLQDAPRAVTAASRDSVAASAAAELTADAESGALAAQQAQSQAELKRELEGIAAAAPPATAITSTTSVRPIAPPMAAPARPETARMTTAAPDDAKLDEWLRKIVKLQSEGQDKSAEREIEGLRKSYPGLDIQAALERLRKKETGQP